MSGPLESSATLDEVLAIVRAKRVPLAPELAGYLALEIAEGAAGAPGEIDPKQVYIGDEGAVALVRPKPQVEEEDPNVSHLVPKTPKGMEDPEASIRAILAQLLEASGAQTP